MPIYAYKCESCGHAKDVLQKMSDPLLTDCPACGKATFKKQVTSAGFQLKGSGWYATDFKGGSAPVPAEGDKGAEKSGDKSASTSDSASASDSSAKLESKSDAKSESKADSKPVATPSSAASNVSSSPSPSGSGA